MRNLSRWFLAFTCVLALGAGCGDDGDDDDDDDDDDDSAIDAGDDVDAAPDSAAGAAPSIDEVSWTVPLDCEVGDSGPFDITVTVSDADTPTGDLTISGSVPSCTGVINSDSVTITCPNLAPYNGSVTVSDPEGHEDTQAITLNPCTNGSAP
jgi:hypothetical protein